MKKIIATITIIVLLTLCMCLALWAKWCYATQKEMSLSISNVIGEKRYLEDSVKELLTRKSIQLDSIELRRGNEH